MPICDALLVNMESSGDTSTQPRPGLHLSVNVEQETVKHKIMFAYAIVHMQRMSSKEQRRVIWGGGCGCVCCGDSRVTPHPAHLASQEVSPPSRHLGMWTGRRGWDFGGCGDQP